MSGGDAVALLVLYTDIYIQVLDGTTLYSEKCCIKLNCDLKMMLMCNMGLLHSLKTQVNDFIVDLGNVTFLENVFSSRKCYLWQFNGQTDVGLVMSCPLNCRLDDGQK